MSRRTEFSRVIAPLAGMAVVVSSLVTATSAPAAQVASADGTTVQATSPKDVLALRLWPASTADLLGDSASTGVVERRMAALPTAIPTSVSHAGRSLCATPPRRTARTWVRTTS